MKPIFLLLFLGLGLAAGAQNNPETIIGQVKGAGAIKAMLLKTGSGSDTGYVLRFRNPDYEHQSEFISLPFVNTDNTLDRLYQLLKETVNGSSAEKHAFNIGGTAAEISLVKISGKAYAYVHTSQGGMYLNKKEVGRLFGR